MKDFLNKLKYYNRDIPPVTKAILAFLLLYLLYRLRVVFSQPVIFFYIVILLFSLLMHEIAHGVAAYAFGDTTAKRSGRLSLNPLNHLDPIGTLVPVLLILSGSSGVIGWAKPVPINYYRLKGGRFGEFCVAIAGVVTNIILAAIGVYIFKYQLTPMSNPITLDLVRYFLNLNLILAIFNLVPIPPLDGSRILASVGNKDLRESIFFMDRYGIIILIVMIQTGILSNFIEPVYAFLLTFLDKII